MLVPLRWCLLSLIFFRASLGHADELVEEGLSVKALGMGNAYLSAARGHDALFYNPAGFTGMEGFQWRITGLSVGLNGLDVYSEYQDIFDDSDDLAGTLNQLYGRPVWARTDLQTSFSFGPLIFGAYARANIGFTVLNPALPNLDANYFADYNYFVGYGAEVIPQHFDAGFLLKRVVRYGGNADIGASTIAHMDSNLIEESVKKEGTAYGADFGAKLKFPTPWNPSLSFAWKDIGDTTFSVVEGKRTLPSIKDQMSLGLGLEREFAGFATIRGAFDYKYLDRAADEIQVGKRIHAGVEVELPAVTLRGGFNQGYYTAGASFDFWIFQIDVATYGVELGEYVGQLEDRRYMVQFTTDFRIDSISGEFFNLSKARRRGLKQRR